MANLPFTKIDFLIGSYVKLLAFSVLFLRFLGKNGLLTLIIILFINMQNLILAFIFLIIKAQTRHFMRIPNSNCLKMTFSGCKICFKDEKV